VTVPDYQTVSVPSRYRRVARFLARCLDACHERIDDLTRLVRKLRQQVKDLKAKLTAMAGINAQLVAERDELRRRLGDG
jgi:predicted RNase H-like nuclease (RuvC/YqgF family)